MIHLQVPQFDKFNNYKFTNFKTVKIKNKPDSSDYNKITKELPGICQGYVEQVYTIGETKKPIEVSNFYDIRQGKTVKKFKGYFITVLN